MKSNSGTSLSPITIDNYVRKLARVYYLITGKEYDGGWKIFLEPEKVMKKLHDSGLKSLKDYISPIVRLLKHYDVDEDIIKAYNEDMKTLKGKEDHVRKENKATEKEKENAMTLDEINKKLDSYDASDNKKMLYKLITALYFQNQLIARNNYWNMKVASNNKKNKDLNANFNYLLVEGTTPKSIVLLNYKTAGTYGLQKFPITNSKLKTTIKEYLEAYNKKPGDFLITSSTGHEYKASSMADLVAKATKEVLGKPMNIDLIRKIHITTFYKEGLHSENDIEAFAKRLLHNKDKSVEYKKVDLYED